MLSCLLEGEFKSSGLFRYFGIFALFGFGCTLEQCNFALNTTSAKTHEEQSKGGFERCCLARSKRNIALHRVVEL